jgi:hypothetical protein
MQVRSDANYYRSRAEEERAAAEAAAGKESRELHLNLAAAYERAALREASGATAGRDDPEQESWIRPMAVIPHANASWRDPEPGK